MAIRGPTLLAVLALCAACETKKSAQPETSPAPAIAPQPVAPQPVAPTEAEPQAPLEISSLPWERASAWIRLELTDSVDTFSKGQIRLAEWADKQMTWGDVSATQNETTEERVRKDSEPELFKRMCVKGKIDQIFKVEIGAATVFRGIIAGRYRPTSFIAVRNTGDLVERKRARFCGLVAGNYAYSSVEGRQIQTVLLVGMFDIAENKGPPGAEASH